MYESKYIKYKKKYLRLKNKLVPNLKKLRDHGTDGSFLKWKKKLGFKISDPFCLQFHNSDKSLFYIGAKHTIDSNSLTYKYIKYVIDNLREPEIVLLEGIPFEYGLNPDISYFQGEGLYAAELARKNQIPYAGIEVNEKKILEKMSEIYDIDDIYGFIYLRAHKYYFRTFGKNEMELDTDFQHNKKKFLDQIFDYNLWDPKIWFQKVFGKKFKYGKDLEFAAPYTNSKIITQQISSDYAKERDKENLINLYKYINTYNKICLIMGENHAYADFPVLIDTFKNFKILPISNINRT